MKEKIKQPKNEEKSELKLKQKESKMSGTTLLILLNANEKQKVVKRVIFNPRAFSSQSDGIVKQKTNFASKVF